MMSPLRSALAAASFLGILACSSGTTTAPGNGGSTGTGSTRTMTATANGVAFSPTLLTSAYLGNQVSVNAADATHNLAINAINVTATGTISVAAGNANSAIVTWLDGTGNFTSGISGGTGTVTFTTLKLGRVAGSFNLTVRNQNIPTNPPITLVGTFDIPFP